MFIISLIILLLTLGKPYSLCESGQKPNVLLLCLLQKCFQNLEDCFKGIIINVEDCQECAPSTKQNLSPKSCTSVPQNTSGV